MPVAAYLQALPPTNRLHYSLKSLYRPVRVRIWQLCGSATLLLVR